MAALGVQMDISRMEKSLAVGTCVRENQWVPWQEWVCSVAPVGCGCEMSVTPALGFVFGSPGAAPKVGKELSKVAGLDSVPGTQPRVQGSASFAPGIPYFHVI